MHRPHDVADDQELGDSTIAGIRSCFGPMAHLDFAVAENDNKVVQYSTYHEGIAISDGNCSALRLINYADICRESHQN